VPIFRPLVEYRDHGTNHWLGTPADMAKEQAYRLRRRMLIDAFGQRLGLCERYRQYAKRELRSKPQPTPDNLACYLKIVRRATHLNWFRRLELQFIL